MHEEHLARPGQLVGKAPEPGHDRLRGDAGAGETVEAGSGGERAQAASGGSDDVTDPRVVRVAELGVRFGLHRGRERDDGNVGFVAVEQREAALEIVIPLVERKRSLPELEHPADEARCFAAGSEGLDERRGEEVLVNVEARQGQLTA